MMEYFIMAVGIIASYCFGRTHQLLLDGGRDNHGSCDNHPDLHEALTAMAKCCATIAEAEGMRLGGTRGADIGRGIAATIRKEFPA
jgi:hypothetical protein